MSIAADRGGRLLLWVVVGGKSLSTAGYNYLLLSNDGMCEAFSFSPLDLERFAV